MRTTEHHIWSTWDEVANTNEWGIQTTEGRLARLTWADDNIMFGAKATITTWSAAKALIMAVHYVVAENDEYKCCVYNAVGSIWTKAVPKVEDKVRILGIGFKRYNDGAHDRSGSTGSKNAYHRSAVS